MSFDLTSPSDAPRSIHFLILSSDPAVTKLSQPNALANCIPAVPIPLAPA